MKATRDVSERRVGIDPMATTSDQVYEDAMAEATKLGLMSDGKATDRAQCPTCEVVFSTAGNFDRHLMKNRDRENFSGEWCQGPASVGLVQNVSGIWLQPGSDDAEYLQNRAS